jgi:hypothetical protein
VIGSQEEGFRINPVWVEIVPEQIKVKDLIVRAVEAQIHELLTNQKLDPEHASQILERYYPEQDPAGTETEDVSSAGKRRGKSRETPLNLRTEIQRARKAFQSGAIVIFVDGQQVQDLKQQVSITAETKIKFIRLIPLKGG